MKILCTGANGMMGWGVKKVFKEDELILTDKKELDVTNIDKVMDAAALKPDIIFHLAAETNHLHAELEPQRCYYINTIGTFNMVELARKLDIPIVYIGTCGMFDGSEEFYTEYDQPHPLNHYSRSKYYAEAALLRYRQHYIVRCGWSMGGGPGLDKKFIGLIYQQIKKGVNTLYAINDVYGSPTYTPDFSEELRKIVDYGIAGITHVANSGIASRYDMAKVFVKALGASVEVIPVSYEEYHKMHPVQVPYTRREVLSTIFSGTILRPWQEALTEYAKECFL